MAADCPERLNLEFLRYIWNFEKEDTPDIIEGLAKHGPDVPVFILNSRHDAGKLLALVEKRDTN